MNTSYLLDKDFLQELDLQKNRKLFAKVIALDMEENPIEQIEGSLTTGSINIDGTSAIRRTCSFTMVLPLEESEKSKYTWALHTKFKLEVGIENNINSIYPNICWFKQGTYIITSFSTSFSATNRSISIQGKDKMCLLNGELGGSLPASIDFGKEEIIDYNYIPILVYKNEYQPGKYYHKDGLNKYVLTYKINNFDNFFSPPDSPKTFYIREQDTEGNDKQYLKYNQLPLRQIIREGVHAWGQEPYHNIIIEDLETYGLKQLTYRGDVPLYLIKQIATDNSLAQLNIAYDSSEIEYCLVIPSSHQYWDENNGHVRYRTIKEWFDEYEDENSLVNFYPENNENQERISLFQEKGKMNSSNPYYTFRKIEYGDDIGYKITELVYNDDLISSIGEAFTSILDKIKNMLGDFEYFYNLDGQFVFRRKQTYAYTSWSAQENKLDTKETYVNASLLASPVVYNFVNNSLISAFNNNPTLTNLKNDYSIWGERTGISGAKIPIHIRYAIDEKPKYYKSISGLEYYFSFNYCYQNNLSFKNYYDNLLSSALQANLYPTEKKFKIQFIKNLNNGLYDTHDIKIRIVDWREIIYQMAKDYFKYSNNTDKIKENSNLRWCDGFLSKIAENNPEYYPTGITGYEQYYTDIQGFWRQLYVPSDELKDTITLNENIYGTDKDTYTSDYYFSDSIIADCGLNTNSYKNNILINNNKIGWNKNIDIAPDLLNFWFDFFDSGELMEYSVKKIGARQKVINNTKIKSVYFKTVPNIIFTLSNVEGDEIEGWEKETLEQHLDKSAYTFIKLPKGMDSAFYISTRGLSAKEELENLLYQFAYIPENISITSLPIYYLEPNHRIRVSDESTGIKGEYIVTRITVPLTYNGTMSITANLAPTRII